MMSKATNIVGAPLSALPAAALAANSSSLVALTDDKTLKGTKWLRGGKLIKNVRTKMSRKSQII